jgi:4-hydroxybenzoate polyprenyltransferase
MRAVLRYARERLGPARLAPAAALVAGAAQIAGGWRGAAHAAVDAAVAAGLVTAFRIWDDVADRERDAPAHPERASAQAESSGPLAAVSFAIGAACLTLLALRSGAPAVLLVCGVAGVLAWWYRTRGPRSGAGDHLLLVKYPVIAAAIAGPSSLTSVRGALSIAIVYLAACIHEWRHDPRSPVAPRTRVIEVTLLVCAASGLVLFLERMR